MAGVCEEEIDPRIKEELERLNSSTDQINSLELRLDEARAAFRQALTESTHSLNSVAKKIGSVIEKARPYYEARQRAKEAQQETQKAALRFERACSMLTAAKEMVDLAEQGLFQDGRTFDANWQEMLNHATMKVGEAENERTLSVHEHLSTAAKFNESEREVKRLQRSLRSSINKSRPYFEMKVNFNLNLEKRKRIVSELEKDVTSAKQVYSNALRNLEKISDQIHEQRRASASKLGQRESGVGAEASPIISETSSPCRQAEVERLDLVIKHHMEQHATPKQRCEDNLELPQRPFSCSQPTSAPDPHAILMSYESTEHLDNISDTISCHSEPILDLDDNGEGSLGILASRTSSSLTFEGTENFSDGSRECGTLDKSKEELSALEKQEVEVVGVEDGSARDGGSERDRESGVPDGLESQMEGCEEACAGPSSQRGSGQAVTDESGVCRLGEDDQRDLEVQATDTLDWTKPEIECTKEDGSQEDELFVEEEETFV